MDFNPRLFCVRIGINGQCLLRCEGIYCSRWRGRETASCCAVDGDGDISKSPHCSLQVTDEL